MNSLPRKEKGKGEKKEIVKGRKRRKLAKKRGGRGLIERLTIVRSFFSLRKTSCLIKDLRLAISSRSSSACSTALAI